MILKFVLGLTVIFALGTASPSTLAEFDLDVDEDQTTGALTDGLLIIRYMFGFSGGGLTTGAVSS